MTTPNSQKIASLAKDLTKDYPRSPRDLLAGIPQFVPAHLRHHIDYFFDVYDAEEKRIET